MSENTYDQILSLVDRPSRYLGTEVNSIRKDPKGVKLRFALAFPDLYEIGTSHFGIQILYHVLNQRPEIAAERVFAPGIDMERILKRRREPLTSLESRRPLSEFDIIGFSLLYELNYSNILTLLDLSGLAFTAGQRPEDAPVVIAGGPCTANPEPVAELFDAVLVGDGERAVLQLVDAWLDWKAAGSGGKETLLRSWAEIEGVYVPSLFRVDYEPDGRSRITARKGARRRIRRAVVEDLDTAPFPVRPVVPFGRPIHDRLRLEVSRGCSRGCRFCQAGMIYRPVRERSCDTLLALADAAIGATGYEDLSLLSLSTGDHSALPVLLSRLMDRCGPDRVAVSLPSFRAGSLTPEMMERIRRVRKTGFTIAPEAGSQRLRDVINKNLTDAEIEKTVADAFSLGWQVIKLYFMVGLPTETEADRDALVELVYRLRGLRKKARRKGQINVSVTTFIPKAHTPFQWAGQLSLRQSKAILADLRHRLSAPGIQFKWQAPEVSLLEGLWARGDRRLLPLLIRAWEAGCRFDGWSDHFRFDRWQQAVDDLGVDVGFFTQRERSVDEPLPWDHIDMRVDRSWLEDEWEKARRQEETPDCRTGSCSGCGVCDFERTFPVYSRSASHPEPATKAAAAAPAGAFWMRAIYEKVGDARHFGHLETAAIFARALRRTGMPLVYSKGFHPKPRMVFTEPLPVGMESEQEAFDVQLSAKTHPDAFLQRVNEGLPSGLRIVDAARLSGKTPMDRSGETDYRVVLCGDRLHADRLSDFDLEKESIVLRRSGKGTLKKIDLKDMVINIVLLTPTSARMTLRSEPGRTLRPAEVLRHVFRLDEEAVRKARIVKLRSTGQPGT